MPETLVDKKPQQGPDYHHYTGPNPSPTMQHPVINISGLVDGLESVPDQSPALPPYPGAPGLAAQNPTRDLHFIRNLYPFVPIMPLPKVVTRALTAGIAQDLNLPSGTVVAMFKGTGDFWLSWSGTAALPVSTGNYSDVPDTGVLNPINMWWFVSTIHQVSVFAQANCIVQALCFAYRPPSTERR